MDRDLTVIALGPSGQLATRADWKPVHGLVFAFLFGAATSVPAFRGWPLLWVVPLVVYAVMVIFVPPLRTTFQLWRFGRITASSVAAASIIAVCSGATLVVFHLRTHPDASHFGGFLPRFTPREMLLAGAVFAVVNALCEEVVFRGILFDAVASQWGDRAAVVCTALLFGYGHFHGYPPGLVGAMLASFYGFCLGWLRVFSGGIGLGLLTHVVADAVIFLLVMHPGTV